MVDKEKSVNITNDLKKHDLLVLVGAGASMHAKMPSVDRITKKLRNCAKCKPDWVKSYNRKHPDYKYISHVTHILEKVAGYSRLFGDYEKFIGYLQKIFTPTASDQSTLPMMLYNAAIHTIMELFHTRIALNEEGKKITECYSKNIGC